MVNTVNIDFIKDLGFASVFYPVDISLIDHLLSPYYIHIMMSTTYIDFFFSSITIEKTPDPQLLVPAAKKKLHPV